MKNEKIKQLLLNEDDYNFEKCFEKALQVEMVQKESKSFQPLSVKAIRATEHNARYKSKFNKTSNDNHYRDRSQSKNRNGNSQCGRCGRFHDEKTCPHEWKCFTCQKVGHISPMCRSKQPNQQSNGKYRSKQSFTPKSSVKNIYDEESDSGNFVKQIKEFPEYHERDVSSLEITVTPEDVKWVEQQQISIDERRVIKTLKRIGGSALEYEVDIDKKKVFIECDTGAVVSVMSLEEY